MRGQSGGIALKSLARVVVVPLMPGVMSEKRPEIIDSVNLRGYY